MITLICEQCGSSVLRCDNCGAPGSAAFSATASDELIAYRQALQQIARWPAAGSAQDLAKKTLGGWQTGDAP